PETGRGRIRKERIDVVEVARLCVRSAGAGIYRVLSRSIEDVVVDGVAAVVEGNPVHTTVASVVKWVILPTVAILVEDVALDDPASCLTAPEIARPGDYGARELVEGEDVVGDDPVVGVGELRARGGGRAHVGGVLVPSLPSGVETVADDAIDD